MLKEKSRQARSHHVSCGWGVGNFHFGTYKANALNSLLSARREIIEASFQTHKNVAEAPFITGVSIYSSLQFPTQQKFSGSSSCNTRPHVKAQLFVMLVPMLKESRGRHVVTMFHADGVSGTSTLEVSQSFLAFPGSIMTFLISQMLHCSGKCIWNSGMHRYDMNCLLGSGS
ncbi:hypothetical protein CDAR_305941 [Caerostris darwini]|uniref:Uncharacterized protein n=1 Tax=Caerostris darwini TaxID=1538125 RepID=A0AAV4VRB7_9ARAC|nr:hypothetical protein CDAR_305941 [Caerostris darwini]